jgi:ribosome-associated protein
LIKRGSTFSKQIAKIIYDKKGDDILILDLRRHSPIADFFVIGTASSSVHAQAIADAISGQLALVKHKPHHVEGYGTASWILLDYLSVVVHIFLAEVRSFYGLERLWGDVPKVGFDGPAED